MKILNIKAHLASFMALLLMFGVAQVATLFNFHPVYSLPLSDFNVTPSSTTPGAIADYTFSFTTLTDVPSSPAIILKASFPTGYSLGSSSATVALDGVPVMVGEYWNGGGSAGGGGFTYIRINTAVTTGTEVSIVYQDVVNPSTDGVYTLTTLGTANSGGNFYDTANDEPITIGEPAPEEEPGDATFPAGDGSVEDPYIVANCEQLQAIDTPLLLSQNYQMQADIDCSMTNPDDDDFDNGGTWADEKGFNPLGAEDQKFTGTFNGGGNDITGLYINRADDLYQINMGEDEEYVGLFGFTLNATISNINLVNIRVRGWHAVGGLVGYAANSAISGVEVNVGVADNSCAPGLCVWARWGEAGGGAIGIADESTISDIDTGGPVKGSGITIGGVVGQAINGTAISEVASTSNIDGGDSIGGLVGRIEDSSLVDGQAEGDVDVVYDDGIKQGYRGGGAVGHAENSLIDTVTASGDVSGYRLLGGLVGEMINGTVTDSSATGDIEASDGSSGGFIGALEDGGDIFNSSATGAVSGASADLGGFAGYAASSGIYNSHATGNVVGSGEWAYNLGGFAGGAYCGAAFEEDYATGDVTGVGALGGFVGGDGCEDYGGSYYNSYATGDVTATGDDVGGFIGQANVSLLNRTYATGAVTGANNVGGLVGRTTGVVDEQQGNSFATFIRRSFATGNVTASDESAGGLVGVLEGGIIEEAYARGDVQSGLGAAGLVPIVASGSQVSDSYATGEVADGEAVGGFAVVVEDGTEVTNSFWDIETSGQDESDAGTGLSTAQMKSKSTYLSVDWDFDDEWNIASEQNDGYPCLQWAEDVCALDTEQSDSDNDGISDQEEQDGPNGGDANGDEEQDSGQSNVLSYINPITNEYAVLETDCESIANFQVGGESSEQPDTEYDYPMGLASFWITCENPGDTANIKQYYYGVEGSDKYGARKWLADGSYKDLPDARPLGALVDDQVVFLVEYTIKDGTEFDDDGVEDGVIRDPSGAAVLAAQDSATEDLANTGQNVLLPISFSIMLSVCSVSLVYLTRRKKLTQ